MLLKKVLSRLVGKGEAAVRHKVADEALLDRATRRMEMGDTRAAIKDYRHYLEGDPANVRVLNDLGACLAEIGDVDQASAHFELAHSLDDTFIPAMVNHAKLLHDYHRGAEALGFLDRAKISQPNFMHADSVYAGVMLKKGDTPRARAFQAKAWFAGFDNLRSANSHLFWMGYDDIDEAQLAAEHRFWAETVKPLPGPVAGEDEARIDWPEDTATAAPPPAGGPARRIRIGYWSPDFRNHSVRYFSRPLLQGHDRTRFEVIMFHDIPARDVQTDRFEALADHFYSVSDLTDAQLRDFIRSQELDILVDLAGHTSHNRVSLLQYRMARFQMNALGYPPTTGLSEVDLKLVDRHVVTAESAQYYVERPLALPTSFWCFDPMEPAPIAAEPPCTANGFVTFGCVGNIAKITRPVAQAWIRILDAVPGSRLLLRSVSFADPIAEEALLDRLAGWGLPMDRLDFRKPEGSTAFFTSYNEIDIILDTFPFNGGTTTAFATYMGVPVVTMYGQSLISRMGLSMMANLGEPGLAVHDLDAYVRVATELAGDAGRVRRFKQSARGLYETTPLGNGTLFAREFEAACEALVQEAESPGGLSKVAVLPAEEIVRRAYAVMRYSQPEAAQRILGHCIRHYPDAGVAHLLHAQILVWAGLLEEAVAHLVSHLPRFTPADQVPAWISVARMRMLQQDTAGARAALDQLRGLPPADDFDQAQVELYHACLDESPSSPAASASTLRRFHFVVPCDSRPQFEVLRQQIEDTCLLADGASLTFERCDEQERVPAYESALRRSDVDVVVLLQKSVQIHQPRFQQFVAQSLAQADIVASVGALRWKRLDWRFDDFVQKAGGFMAESSERKEMTELHVLGHGRQALVPGMALLDGALLAARAGGAIDVPFDEALLGAETLMEEAWSHAAGRAGARLAVHRNLGVFLDADVELDSGNRTEARLHCNGQHGFDPWGELRDDLASLSAPVESPAQAAAAFDRYFTA